MATIVKRKVGETGNSLVGKLTNRSGTLTLPNLAVVTLNAKRLDTGQAFITGGTVVVLDVPTKTALGYLSTDIVVQYDFQAQDVAGAGTFELTWVITPTNLKPTYIPDDDSDDLWLVVWA